MKVRYFVVDDAPFIRELIKSIMAASGHVCVGEAGDGAEAIELIPRVLPDLVFMDLVLPRKNGARLTREIFDLWPEVKVIACTTMEKEELPLADRDLFHDWVSKPFTASDLNEALKRTILNREKSV